MLVFQARRLLSCSRPSNRSVAVALTTRMLFRTPAAAGSQGVHQDTQSLHQGAVARGSSAQVDQPLIKRPTSEDRKYPKAPYVGIGVVVLRLLGQNESNVEVLLVRRAKEPSKGQWSFPGGGLYLGETMADCAAREVLEETGLVLRNRPGVYSPVAKELLRPTAFAAVDAVTRDRAGEIAFHYAIVELAAVPEDPQAPLEAGDDADAVRWMPVKDLHSLPDLTPGCTEIAVDAVERFI